ncbi:MAG: MFS transporter, partial [Burkholderiales bacterium]|nr:MFS transporter [Burkholderiales bacterium]
MNPKSSRVVLIIRDDSIAHIAFARDQDLEQSIQNAFASPAFAKTADAPVLRLWLNAFAGYVCIGSMIQVMPAYVQARFTVSPYAVGVAVTVGFLATMIARPIAGRLVDARGARGIVMAGTIGAALGGVAHLLAPNYFCLILARLMLGLGEGALFTASIGWVLSGATNKRSGGIAGRFGLSMWGGLTVGPIIGAALDAIFGFRAVWLMASVLPVAGLILVATTSGGEAVRDVRPAPSRSWFPAAARGPSGSYVFSSIGYGVIASCLVPRMTTLDLPERNFALAVFGVAFLGARFLASPLVDHLGPRRMLIAALVVEIVGLLG